MNYIPSQYSYDDVLNILDKEKNSDTSRIIPAVIVYFMLRFANDVFFLLLFMSGLYEMYVKHNFQQIFFVLLNYFSQHTKYMTMPQLSSLVSIICFFAWILVIDILSRFMNYFIKKYGDYLKKRGLLIDGKHEKNKYEIMAVYKDIQKYEQYISDHPNLKPEDFHIEYDTNLVHTKHYIDGDESVKFYFGSHLRDIIVSHETLDFSKLDKLYEIVKC